MSNYNIPSKLNIVQRLLLYVFIAIVMYLLQAFIHSSFNISEFNLQGKVVASVVLLITIYMIEVSPAIKKQHKQ